MSKPLEEMSPEAQELLQLTGTFHNGTFELTPGVDVGAIIAERPELAKGLSEYIACREEHAASVAKADTAQGVAHPLAEALTAATGAKKEGDSKK